MIDAPTARQSEFSDEEVDLKLNIISIISRMTYEELSNPAVRETILSLELEKIYEGVNI